MSVSGCFKETNSLVRTGLGSLLSLSRESDGLLRELVRAREKLKETRIALLEKADAREVRRGSTVNGVSFNLSSSLGLDDVLEVWNRSNIRQVPYCPFDSFSLRIASKLHPYMETLMSGSQVAVDVNSGTGEQDFMLFLANRSIRRFISVSLDQVAFRYGLRFFREFDISSHNQEMDFEGSVSTNSRLEMRQEDRRFLYAHMANVSAGCCIRSEMNLNDDPLIKNAPIGLFIFSAPLDFRNSLGSIVTFLHVNLRTRSHVVSLFHPILISDFLKISGMPRWKRMSFRYEMIRSLPVDRQWTKRSDISELYIWRCEFKNREKSRKRK